MGADLGGTPRPRKKRARTFYELETVGRKIEATDRTSVDLRVLERIYFRMDTLGREGIPSPLAPPCTSSSSTFTTPVVLGGRLSRRPPYCSGTLP